MRRMTLMLSLTLIVVCMLSLTIILSAHAAVCVDLTGMWNVVAINPPGDLLPPATFPGTLTINQSACSFSGTIYSGDTVLGTVSGSSVNFQRIKPIGSGFVDCQTGLDTVPFQTWTGTISSDGASM